MALIPLDHKIKSAVAAWREKGCERASPVTQRLLDFWFKEEHWLKVSELTGERWTFVKVLQPDFERFRDLSFNQLMSVCREHT